MGAESLRGIGGLLRFAGSYLAAGKIAAAAMAANAIALAVAPFITRRYGPDEFGLYSTFIALTFADVAICLGLERMVPLARTNSEAGVLFWLSVLLSAVVSVVVALAAGLLALGGFTSREFWIVLFALPISMLLVGWANVLTAWCIRHRDFRSVAVARVSQALVVATVQVVAAPLLLFNRQIGLVLGHISGAVATIAVLWYFTRPVPTGALAVAIARAWRLIRQSADYLAHVAPATLTNSFALQVPVLFFSLFYDQTSTGHFGLTQRVAAAPMAVIAVAVGQVFAGRVSAVIRSGGSISEVDRLYRRTAVLMAVIGAPLWLLWLPAPFLFESVFGAEWEESGYFFRAMVPLYFLQFVVGPLQSLLIVIGRHRMYALTEFIRLASVLTALGAAYLLGLSPIAAVSVLAILACCGYLSSAIASLIALGKSGRLTVPIVR